MLRDIFIQPLLLSKSNAAEDSCQVLNVCLTSANKNTNCLNVLEFCVATLACFQGPRLHRGAQLVNGREQCSVINQHMKRARGAFLHFRLSTAGGYQPDSLRTALVT